MTHRLPPDRDGELLSDLAAARLLARASELDAAGAKIADLRAAAAEAGISSRAFDEALAELRAAAQSSVADVRGLSPRRSRIWALTAGIAALVAASAIFVTRAFPPTVTQAGVPIVEEAIALRCLAPGQAAALIRPSLSSGTSSIVHSVNAPRIITIRGTAEEIANARSILDQNESAGSPACATGPATTPSPPK